ncbi:hypothetical protein BDR03DRAFT_1018127 [Suillus americanus]|nr:hypothetical protein BDR03DRAFT_1018127 [Suillus americanus]
MAKEEIEEGPSPTDRPCASSSESGAEHTPHSDYDPLKWVYFAQLSSLERIVLLQPPHSPSLTPTIHSSMPVLHQHTLVCQASSNLLQHFWGVPLMLREVWQFAALSRQFPIPVSSSSVSLISTPGAQADELQGGVASGSILTGILQPGQEVEIHLGIVMKDTQDWNHSFNHVHLSWTVNRK